MLHHFDHNAEAKKSNEMLLQLKAWEYGRVFVIQSYI